MPDCRHRKLNGTMASFMLTPTLVILPPGTTPPEKYRQACESELSGGDLRLRRIFRRSRKVFQKPTAGIARSIHYFAAAMT
jgi:hypothetical protein